MLLPLTLSKLGLRGTDLKKLSQQQIQNLLLQDQQKPALHRATTWPSSNDNKLLFEAASKKKKQVTFSNGRVFDLKYARREASVAWKEYDVVFVSPADGSFVPCGWFHIKFLSKES